jgi:hypothetical protein
MTSSGQQNLETARGAAESFASGVEDAIAFLEPHASANLEYCPALAPGVDGQPLLIGFEQARDYLRAAQEKYPDWIYSDPRVEQVGDRVVLTRLKLASTTGADPTPPPEVYAVDQFDDGGFITKLYDYAE